MNRHNLIASSASSDARLTRVRETDTPQVSAVSFRAVLIGLVSALFFCAVTPYNDFKIAATYIAGTQFPIGAIFVELLLVGIVNVALRKWAPKKAFRPGELLTIWTLILVASGLPSSGMMRYLIPGIVYPEFASNDQNGWQAKVWGSAPDWLKVRDQEAVDAFFKGYPRGQEHVPWDAWIGPLFFWGILAVLFLVASFCVSGILRRQWIENEKFSFPLVTLPVMLAEEPRQGRLVNDLLRSPLLWVGFFLVTALHTVRGLHMLYPSVPDIKIAWNLMEHLQLRPLNQIGPIDLIFYPMVIGLSYLLPAEVCFSMWFFHVFYKGEILLGATYNWDMPGGVGSYSYKAFHSLQAFGGGVALLAWTCWTARYHLRDIWEKATNGPRAKEIDDSREMISYRAMFWGTFLSYAGIGLWLWFAGVPLLLIGISLLILTLGLVTISWVVCQAGLLFMAQPYATTDVLASTFGTAPFKVPALYTVARWENAFLYDTREMLAPSALIGAKTAESAHFDVRPLFKAMVLAVVLGMVVSAIASIMLPYYNGGGNSLNNPWMYSMAPSRPISFFGGAAAVPYKGSWTNWGHIFGGFGGFLGLLILRAQYNFGIHPIGFLCASVYSMHMLWFSIFLGWVAKTLIQRYGGMKGYTGALPLFLGLILGDVVNAVVWIILGYVTKVGYQIMPG